ncbi:MAG TPA: lytic transglycosylase domain-containing protein [Beijerinckiaceae bacterium]|nr:lytic transglycosylase domain-containing protein [Beijerinckiaceae bacterium]
MSVSTDVAQLITQHAVRYHVPEPLIYSIIKRESGFNPKAHHSAYWGLMQISNATARSVGYRGPPEGLLDADTNLTYGVLYLANAYIVAHGDSRRAMTLYSRGYYYEAKHKGLLGALHTAAVAQ